jgi:hypothetical protein
MFVFDVTYFFCFSSDPFLSEGRQNTVKYAPSQQKNKKKQCQTPIPPGRLKKDLPALRVLGFKYV